MSLPYPPPYQDARTLSEHLCLSVDTIEKLVKQGDLPAPIMRAGKRLWRWREVEKALAPQDNTGATSPDTQAESITNATRAAATRNH